MTTPDQQAARQFLAWLWQPANTTWREDLTFFYLAVSAMSMYADPAWIIILVASTTFWYYVWVVRSAWARYNASRTMVYDRNNIRWRRW